MNILIPLIFFIFFPFNLKITNSFIKKKYTYIELFNNEKDKRTREDSGVLIDYRYRKGNE